MNVLSVVWGIVTLVFGMVAFIPGLGWGNWLVVPMAIIGVVLGALSKRRGGMVLNIVALLLAFFRLIIGGGLI